MLSEDKTEKVYSLHNLSNLFPKINVTHERC